MRGALAVIGLCTCACGRIGFDAVRDGPAGGDDGGGGDGPPMVDARATVAPPTTISDPTAMASCPSLVWNGSLWAVAWRDVRDAMEGEVYVAIAGADGTKINSDVRVTNDPAFTGCPSLVWTGPAAGNTFFVVFEDDRFGNAEIAGQFISTSGALLGAIVRITSDNGLSAEPAIGWNGSGFDLAWTDTRGVNDEVHYVTLDAAGMANGVEMNLGGTGPFVNGAGVAETSSGVAIGWYDATDADVMRTAIAQGGTVVANAGSTGSAVGAFTGPAALAWSGTDLAVTWVAEPVPQDRELAFANVDPTTSALSNVHELGVPGARNPSIVAGNDGFAVAQEPGARLELLTVDGQAADAAVPLTGGSDPSLAFDGTWFGCAIVRNQLVELVRVMPL